MQSLLESDGHTVEAVRSIEEARMRLADLDAPLDVLVTDIGLPDGSGWDLVAFAREKRPALRIGVVTGLGAAQRAGSRVRLHPAQTGRCNRFARADCGRRVNRPKFPRCSILSSILAMPDTGSIRILIAEDDDNARALLVELLNSMGHVVVAEVTGGRDAIERAKDVVPDVVLLDVHMPDGSGIEAAEQIAAQVPGVAVVLFSGDQTLSLTEREVAATAAIAFLPKPTPPRVLDSTLRLAVSRAREFTNAKKDAAAARGALENRKTIERAKGILMRRTGSSEQEAYRILQRTSQDRSVPMVEIARAVLASEPGLQENAKEK